ncbi:PAS domain S-box protein [Kaarinaea lacus]
MNINNDRIVELIFENTHTCIAYLDTSFNFIRVNSAYAKADGKPPEYFRGKNHFDLFPNKDNEAIFRKVVDTGEPHFAYAIPFEYEHSPERGITHWDWTLHPVHDQNGNTVGVILNLVDVTQHIQIEQALIQEKHFTDAVLQSAGTIVVVLDASGKVVRFNKACVELTGYSDEEICGEFIWEHLLVPEEKESVKNVFQDLTMNALPSQFTNYWVTKNGEKRLLHWWNTVITDQNGSVKNVIAVGFDTTEQKHTEDALKQQAQIIDQIHDGVVSTDLEGIVTSWNRGAERLFGYSASEAIGRHITFVYPEDQHDTLINQIIAPLKDEGENDIEVTMRKKNGEDFCAHLSLSLQRNGDNEVVGMLGYSMDITERKFAEQKLRQLNEQLEQRVQQRTNDLRQSIDQILEEMEVRKQTEEKLKKAKEDAERANRLKSEFLRRMSHELRTPMNAILGFGQLIKQNDPQHADYADEIMLAGHHLLNLINEVLDLAKIESGKIDLHMTAIYLQDIADQCITLVTSEANKKTIRLHNELSDDEPIQLTTDAERLKEVLINLLCNAVKYTSQGGLVRLWTQSLHQGTIRINITDNGAGLTAEQIDTIFEPFNRLGAEYSGIEGTGIGLTIAKQIIEHLGGNIGVISEPAQGSTFWVELPLNESLPQPPPCSAESVNNVVKPLQQTTATVVYVEDNPANMRLVESIFRLRPHVKLLTAENAETGLKLVQQHVPQLVILDIDLPLMNGYEALEKLRTNDITQHIPVYALTAAAMVSDVEKGIRAGFERYITKPIQVGEFLQCIDDTLDESDTTSHRKEIN